MISPRRGRIAFVVVFIVVVAVLTWKNDFLWTSETLVEYESPLRPPAAEVIVTIPPSQTTTPVDADSNANIEKAGPELPNKSTQSNGQAVDPSSVIGPFTVIPEGAYSPGFTLLDNLYLRNGTFYAITKDVSKFPPLADMISAPRELGENVDTTPTNKQMQFLSADNVESILGKHAIRIEGLSIVVYDPPQFMTHLYHWWGEIILGAWRILSFEGGKTKEVPMPRRFLLPFSVKGKFRDPAGVNAPLMRAAWPSAQIEESDYWEDLITLDATVVFDRLMLINRPAAHRQYVDVDPLLPLSLPSVPSLLDPSRSVVLTNFASPMGGRWNKMIAGTMDITVADNFWEPLRKTIVSNLVGHLPSPEPTHGAQESLPKPLVMYVSRQRANSRRLAVKDHEALLGALRNLEEQGVCEFREARMEEMSLREQVELAARSTIIIGVHGNGLTVSVAKYAIPLPVLTWAGSLASAMDAILAPFSRL
ncbi:hypothetical protein C0995_006634 [Termitomyces sp. Mi166|nr:hypothetical protein C0995_006634 [Termitomyces sp. Mi166\